MKQIIFFPYHPDIFTLISNRDMLIEYRILGVVSFKDDDSLVKKVNCELGIGDVSYEQLLSRCDTVVILDNYREYISSKYYEIIDTAIKFQKEVLITPLAESQLDLDAYKGQYRLLEFLPNIYAEGDMNAAIQSTRKLHEIDTPIIGVFGMGKHCGKFEIQLMLKRCLEKDYNAAVVSSNALGTLFGCYTIPQFLYEDISFQNKVIRFNYYISCLAKLIKPDIIVLGIPEGIVPFEKEEFHHFAEYPLIVSTAVQIDSAVLCMYFTHNYSYELIQKDLNVFSNLCRGKFNAYIDMYAISKTRFEQTDEGYAKIMFEFLDKEFLDKYYPIVSSINLPMINMTDIYEAEATIKDCIFRLQDNVDAL
jgi:peptide maturation system protein (TIGR04066 family)